MSKIDLPQLRHDFVNNSLRLEILMKMIHEDLKSSITPDDEKLTDLESFLNLGLTHLTLIKELTE